MFLLGLLQQHGLGTHVWILRRTDISQYSRNNRYTGDFVHGQRHGHGTFFYAGGAVYEGEWRNNKKHGKVLWRHDTVRMYSEKGSSCNHGDDVNHRVNSHLRTDMFLKDSLWMIV